MPPSADDLPGKTPPDPGPKRGSGKKRQGKQPGAPGAHLAWTEGPDDRKPLFPEGPCACGRGPGGRGGPRGGASHQLMDTPAVTAAVTQYDEHAVACRCGRVHAAAPPAGRGGRHGHLRAEPAGLVRVPAGHAPRPGRAVRRDHRGPDRDPPVGRVRPLDDRPRRESRARGNMLIRALVITASVLCADETPIRVGPGPKTRKKYLLVACTSLLTCFFLGDRSMKTFDAFVFPDLSAAWSSTTAIRITTRSRASCTSCALSTSCVISRTRPSRTRTRSGPARRWTRCAA